MNPGVSSMIWAQEVAWLAATIAVIAAVGLLLSPRLKSARTRRTLWQACLLAALACTVVQLSGVSREFAWLAKRPLQKAESVTTILPASVQLEPAEAAAAPSGESTLRSPVAASHESAVPSTVVEVRRSHETPLQGTEA